jgi:AcrR family transcriptional regulator
MSQQTMTTKERILEAACLLFAQKGYLKTTTQEICTEAGANIAGVNYHFGGKENLYREVWRHLNERGTARWRETIDKASEPEEQLRQFVRLRVEAVLSSGFAGCLPRVIHREMGDPSPLHDELHETFLNEKREWFLEIVRGIVGRELDEQTLHMAGFCIHSPLIHLLEIHSKPKRGGRRPPPGHPSKDPERLIETICTFALAGLRELVRQSSVEVPMPARQNQPITS